MQRFSLKYSINLKMAIIFFLIIFLLIPAIFVGELIRERKNRKNNVLYEISEKWGTDQTIAGPVISVPYDSFFTDTHNKTVYTTKHIHFLPKDLNIKSQLFPETRYRGIYKAILYNSKIEINGFFEFPEIKDLEIKPEAIKWNQAFISLGITDLKGIKENIKAKLNNNTLNIQPGIKSNDVFESGIHSPVKITSNSQKLEFSMLLNINGSQKIKFLPIGETTKLNLTSTWKDPSFIGSYLPYERTITDKGFNADYKILHLNRNYPQFWSGPKNIYSSAFGVDLYSPVDIYQKSTRLCKYAIIFITFTFTAFFLAEVTNKKRIHPLSYILIGFAVLVFYTLLIAISEHINFDLAYIISAISTILLISLYAKSILNDIKMTNIVGGLLSILYAYLYIILQLENYALLIGSIGLFITLAGIMYFTRKIDWYAYENNQS